MEGSRSIMAPSDGFYPESFGPAQLYVWTNGTQPMSEETISQVIEDGVFFGGNSLQKKLAA
jgi:hypothetical protein